MAISILMNQYSKVVSIFLPIRKGFLTNDCKFNQDNTNGLHRLTNKK